MCIRDRFAPEYKKPIPKYVRTVGVVTAPTGAAVRDIINITRRRNPYVQILLYPALVQGDGASESVVRGIRALEEAKVDVMIVGLSLIHIWNLSVIRETLELVGSFVKIDAVYLTAMLKILGVTYLAEFASAICKDAGYQTIAEQIEVFARPVSYTHLRLTNQVPISTV